MTELVVVDVDDPISLEWSPQAVAAGGKLERPVADQFYGDRTGTLADQAKWAIRAAATSRTRLS